MPELIRVEGLVHRFPDGGLGLDGANLTVDEGDFLVIAGRNGSGKTLLLRHIVGLAEASAGKVLCRGLPVADDPAAARRAIGIVFKDADAQILGQTVAEDLSFGPANLRLSRAEIAARTREALALVGLSGFEERRPDSLSGGEKRKLAIAGLLAMRPRCLLLDEPFANLDYPAIRGVLELLMKLHAGGTTIVAVTHELEKVLAHATRLALMDSGRIVYDGPSVGPGGGGFEALGLRDPFRGGTRLEDLTWLR